MNIKQTEQLADVNIDNWLALQSQLTDARVAKNLSTKDVADRMGVTPQYVEELENYDANPSMQTTRRWATALELELNHTLTPALGESAQNADAKEFCCAISQYSHECTRATFWAENTSIHLQMLKNDPVGYYRHRKKLFHSQTEDATTMFRSYSRDVDVKCFLMAVNPSVYMQLRNPETPTFMQMLNRIARYALHKFLHRP